MSAVHLRLVAEMALDPAIGPDDEEQLAQIARSGDYLFEQLMRLPLPEAYKPFPDTWRQRMETLAHSLADLRPRTALQYRLAADVWADARRAGYRLQ